MKCPKCYGRLERAEVNTGLGSRTGLLSNLVVLYFCEKCSVYYEKKLKFGGKLCKQ